MRFILSAELSHLTEEQNVDRSIQLLNALRNADFAFKTCQGVYKGDSELSFLVNCHGVEDNALIKRLAFTDFKQESILVIKETDSEAYLLYNDNRLEELGKFTEVSQSEAENNDNYTAMYGNDRKTLKYFICK
jgi:hypothetical protein